MAERAPAWDFARRAPAVIASLSALALSLSGCGNDKESTPGCGDMVEVPTGTVPVVVFKIDSQLYGLHSVSDVSDSAQLASGKRDAEIFSSLWSGEYDSTGLWLPVDGSSDQVRADVELSGEEVSLLYSPDSRLLAIDCH